MRKLLGSTQAELVEELGLGQGNLSDIERGINPPSKTLIIALCYRYNVNKDWINTGKGKMFVGNKSATNKTGHKSTRQEKANTLKKDMRYVESLEKEVYLLKDKLIETLTENSALKNKIIELEKKNS